MVILRSQKNKSSRCSFRKMKELLEFIIENLLGNKDFSVEESIDEKGFNNLIVYLNSKDIGLIIGKNGATIKAIRSLLRVRAILGKYAFSLNLQEKGLKN